MLLYKKNVGTLKRRSNEVVETITRKNIDICAIQEHRWSGGIEANQSHVLKGKNPNISSTGVETELTLQGLVSVLPRNGLTKFLTFNVSQTEFFCYVWLLARKFSVPSHFMPHKLVDPTTKRNTFMTYCSIWLPKFLNPRLLSHSEIGMVMLVKRLILF